MGASLLVSSSVVQRDIWVRVQEVPQRRDDLPSMRNIVPSNSRAEIVHQHVPDLLASTIALEQTTTKHNRNHFGNVLVLGNGLNLIRREVTEADQVFKRDHGCLPCRGHQLVVTSEESCNSRAGLLRLVSFVLTAQLHVLRSYCLFWGRLRRHSRARHAVARL